MSDPGMVRAPRGTKLACKSWLTEAARRIERVLTSSDPGMGVVRHVDAGCPIAIETAHSKSFKIPMLKD